MQPANKPLPAGALATLSATASGQGPVEGLVVTVSRSLDDGCLQISVGPRDTAANPHELSDREADTWMFHRRRALLTCEWLRHHLRDRWGYTADLDYAQALAAIERAAVAYVKGEYEIRVVDAGGRQ